LLTHDGAWVYVPRRQPIPVRLTGFSARWRRNALAWLYSPAALDQPFLFIDNDTPSPSGAAAGALSESEYRQALYSFEPTSAGQIREWLFLGPFSQAGGRGDPLDVPFIEEPGADPAESDAAGGRRWRLSDIVVPHDPGGYFLRHFGWPARSNTVVYAYVNLFSPTETNAVLRFASDAKLKVYLLGRQLQAVGNSGSAEIAAAAPLKVGRNRLLVKLALRSGNERLLGRVTDERGNPVAGLIATVDSTRPARKIEPLAATGSARIELLEFSDMRIRFRTTGIGLPHIIKWCYFPNWQVRGASRVYMATPAFMAVYPEQEEVELYYGRTPADNVGRALTALGWLTVCAVCGRRLAAIRWCRRQ